MHEFPQGGLLGKAARTVRAYNSLRIPVYAAYASYFVILSVFPMLLVLLGLLRYTPLDVEELGELLEGFLPRGLQASAEELILRAYDNSSSIPAISLSVAITLWSSSRGIYGLMAGMNSVYGVEEERSYLYTRLLCVGYTLAFLALLILTLGLHVFGAGLLALIEDSAHPLLRFLTGVLDLRYFILLFAQTAVFTAMFMVLPCKRNRLGESLPGALLASLGWLIFSNLYSVYMENFAHLSNIYGSVYAVALYMLWLYCCVSIVLSGGALNRFLAEN